MTLLRHIGDDGNRYLLWPISFAWGHQLPPSSFFAWHGWQVGSEPCALEDTAQSCVHGFRGVFGQTLHIGRLKILFGSPRDWCAFQMPGSASVGAK